MQRKLGVEEGLELLVKRRGARPLGGGEVVLRVPVLRQMPPVSLTDEGEGWGRLEGNCTVKTRYEALAMPLYLQSDPLPFFLTTSTGMVKRIRGVSYSMKVSPQNTNRMVDGARGVLNALLSDVYIFTDAVSGE